MNHYGIAREAAAIYSLTSGSAVTPRFRRHAWTLAAAIQVSIEAPELCGRFTARALCDVRIQPSSGILRERFHLLEQKLISNAVDATNYVTMAMGHPTHAFDRDKLEGGIILRRARKGEKLKTLDGVERLLDPEDLVVADEKKALSLAGVMGGWETMITPETRNVLIEAAWFDPLSVRRTQQAPRPAHRCFAPLRARSRFQRAVPGVGSGRATDPLRRRLSARRIDRRCRSRGRRAHRSPAAHPSQPQRGSPHPGRNRRWPRSRRGDLRERARGAWLCSRKRARGRILGLPCRAGASTSSARSISSRRSPASTDITASRIRCPLSPAPSSSLPGKPRKPRFAGACWPSAGTRRSRAPSARPPTRLPSLRSRGAACPWAIRSVKRPACSARRSCRECSPCWPTTSTAT